jgi:Lon protease-like protein
MEMNVRCVETDVSSMTRRMKREIFCFKLYISMVSVFHRGLWIAQDLEVVVSELASTESNKANTVLSSSGCLVVVVDCAASKDFTAIVFVSN